MLLIVEGKVAPDPWLRQTALGDGDLAAAPIIVPAPVLLGCAPHTPLPARLGVALAAGTDVSGLKPYLARLALVEVDFGNFGDGRGFSTAHALRRAGYAGELRAAGRLMPDQAPQLVGCGFDAVLLDDEEAPRVDDWTRAWHGFARRYQQRPASARLGSILAARHPT